jgi:mannose-6-phosphate isomerase-like protein (cupin superfamily)
VKQRLKKQKMNEMRAKQRTTTGSAVLHSSATVQYTAPIVLRRRRIGFAPALRASPDAKRGDAVETISLREKLAAFSETWSPKIVGELNGQYVKLVKFQGDYVWHFHAHEDELFMVIDGEIEIHFRDRTITLRKDEFCIVPRGVEHKPAARRLASVLLFEPAATRNTGNVDHAYTIEAANLERI